MKQSPLAKGLGLEGRKAYEVIQRLSWRLSSRLSPDAREIIVHQRTCRGPAEHPPERKCV